ALRARLRAALTYPAVMTVATASVLVFLLTWVVPQVTRLFAESGVPLPLPTRILVAVSGALRAGWWIVPLVALARAALVRRGGARARRGGARAPRRAPRGGARGWPARSSGGDGTAGAHAGDAARRRRAARGGARHRRRGGREPEPVGRRRRRPYGRARGAGAR